MSIKRQVPRMFFTFVAVLFVRSALSRGWSQSALAQDVSLIAAGKAQAAIVRPDDALSVQTAARLADYLREHTGVDLPVIGAGDAARHPAKTLVVLDGTDDHRVLQDLGVSSQVPADRDDAFHVHIARPNGRTIVAVAGRSPTGAKFGAYRRDDQGRDAPAQTSCARRFAPSTRRSRRRSISGGWKIPGPTAAGRATRIIARSRVPGSLRRT